MDQLDIDFKEAISMSSRLMTNNLKRQAPYKTGALRNSVRVNGTYNGTSLDFTISSLKYGVFLDRGTGLLRSKSKTRKPWNPKPGSGIGKGGIKPRWWMTLEKSVFEGMRKRVAKAAGKFIVIKVFRNK
jgi:hypothetical protein